MYQLGKAEIKRLVFTFFLKVEGVLHFLMANGRLFHGVDVAFLKHLLLCIMPCLIVLYQPIRPLSSCKYQGAVQYNVLYMYTRILYFDRGMNNEHFAV